MGKGIEVSRMPGVMLLQHDESHVEILASVSPKLSPWEILAQPVLQTSSLKWEKNNILSGRGESILYLTHRVTVTFNMRSQTCAKA